jgi:hypothetical protein
VVNTTNPSLVTVNEQFTYAVPIRNTGQTVLVTVPISQDYDPEFLTFMSAEPMPDQVDTAAGLLLWDDITSGNSLGVNEVITPTILFVAKKNGPTQPSTLIDDARNAQGEVAPQASSSALIEIVNAGVSVEITIVSPADGVVAVGEEVTYRITVTNTGVTRLVSVPVRNQYDATVLEYKSTTLQTPDISTNGNEKILIWDDITEVLGDIEGGETASFTVTFEALREAETVNTVTLGSNVLDEFGDIALACQFGGSVPTALALLSFSATAQAEGVLVQWATGWEKETWGFHLWRSQTANRDEAARVTPQLIPAQGIYDGGEVYRFLDTTVQPERQYAYWLQEVELSGNNHEYGPVWIVDGNEQPATNQNVYLPLIQVR